MQVVILLLAFLSVALANDASCANWCNMLQTQSECTSDFTLGAATNATQALVNCNYWCNTFQFTLGNYDNATGMGDMVNNTIGCRMYYLNKAIKAGLAKDVSTDCPAGSITGGGVCGNRCDTYCQVLEYGNCYPIFVVGSAALPGAFKMQDCQTVCQQYPIGPIDQRVADPSGVNWFNDVQCRLYHAGIPANGPNSNKNHCAHAAPHGGTACGDRCTGYCQMLLTTCAGHLSPSALAGDAATCISSCKSVFGFNASGDGLYADLSSIPAYNGNDLNGDVSISYGPVNALGMSVESENSLSCRTYHATSPAIADPVLHCPHASFEGGGACPSDQCTVYCDLALNPLCSSLLTDYGTNRSLCLQECAKFDTSGTFQSQSGGTLQCRIYHLLVAIQSPGNAATHCPHGRKTPGPSDPCYTAPPTPTPTSGPTAPTAGPTAGPVAPPPVNPTAPVKKSAASGLGVIGFLIPMVLVSLW